MVRFFIFLEVSPFIPLSFLPLSPFPPQKDICGLLFLIAALMPKGYVLGDLFFHLCMKFTITTKFIRLQGLTMP